MKQGRGKKMKSYRYTECGLDNVIIDEVSVVVDDNGHKVYCIPNVKSLHRSIAHALIIQESGLSGKEVRFLRTEMGLTQEQLAAVIKVSRATVNRWESGRGSIDPNAEFLIRMLAAEKLGIDLKLSVEEMAERCVWSTNRQPIHVEGKSTGPHQPKAA